jgi:iron complex outermembrane receptor protein
LDAYELGTKSEWFDHHLRLNGSAFLYNYDDIQILQAVLGGTQLLNAAAAQVKGLDLDAEIRLISNLSITVGMEFLDAHYSKFPNAPATFQSPASCTPVPGELPGPRTGGDTNCVINASGNQMIRAPDFTAPISATYRWDTSFGNISPTLSYYYNSGYPFEPDNRLRQPAYSLVNANLAWTLPDDRYQVSLWGRNLSNTHYYVNMISSVGDVYTAAAPLTFGISLKATW